MIRLKNLIMENRPTPSDLGNVLTFKDGMTGKFEVKVNDNDDIELYLKDQTKAFPGSENTLIFFRDGEYVDGPIEFGYEGDSIE